MNLLINTKCPCLKFIRYFFSGTIDFRHRTILEANSLLLFSELYVQRVPCLLHPIAQSILATRNIMLIACTLIFYVLFFVSHIRKCLLKSLVVHFLLLNLTLCYLFYL